jgi:hypothetical protein
MIDRIALRELLLQKVAKKRGQDYSSDLAELKNLYKENLQYDLEEGDMPSKRDMKQGIRDFGRIRAERDRKSRMTPEEHAAVQQYRSSATRGGFGGGVLGAAGGALLGKATGVGALPGGLMGAVAGGGIGSSLNTRGMKTTKEVHAPHAARFETIQNDPAFYGAAKSDLQKTRQKFLDKNIAELVYNARASERAKYSSMNSVLLSGFRDRIMEKQASSEGLAGVFKSYGIPLIAGAGTLLAMNSMLNQNQQGSSQGALSAEPGHAARAGVHPGIMEAMTLAGQTDTAARTGQLQSMGMTPRNAAVHEATNAVKRYGPSAMKRLGLAKDPPSGSAV